MPRRPANDAPPLPALESIESVSAETLPASTRDATLSDDERKLVAAIVRATANGNVAVGSPQSDKRTATSVGARIKRLIQRSYRIDNVPEDARPSISVTSVPKGKGFAWAIRLVPATHDETNGASAPHDAEIPTETPAHA
jgi:hypothetical protein